MKKHILLLLIFLLFSLKSLSQKNDFEKIKTTLPQPILEEHTGWVDLYWKAWELAYKKIQHGTKANGFVESYLDEGFNPNIFQWDTDFMMMFARYGFNVFPGIVSLDNFYRKQHKNGFICREIREKDGSDYWDENSEDAINPPIFSWAEWEHYRISGNSIRFSKILPVLVKYYDWIRKNRRWKNGLYWSTGWACGMDNSPRAGVDVHENGNYSWIDISAQQALNALYISKIANTLKKVDIEKRFLKEYQELSDLINSKMWDKANGFYFDLNPNGNLGKVKTLAAIWPIIAKIADKKQAEKILSHLMNPQEFWRKHVFSTLSADHPLFNPKGEYWRGSIWAPTNYMVIKGLEVYGFEKEAGIASVNHIENMYEVYKKTGTIWENYAPDTITQGSDSRGDFVGWSGCGPIALLIENVLGFRPYAPKDSLFWRPTLIEKHGIKNLRFGDIVTSIICEKRDDPRQGCKVTIESNKDYKLSVWVFSTLFQKKIKKGINEFILVLE